MKDLIERFTSLARRKEELSEELARTQDDLYRTEDVLIDELRQSRLKSVETEEGESIYLRTQLDVVPERDPEALCKTLRADPRTAWFVRSVCDQELLAAWVRERLEEGNLPEEIAAEIRVRERRTLGVS